jgi:hypothetical protein
VTPPSGSSDPNIDPFGTRYDERTGKCIEDAGWLPNDCDTSKSLEDEARNKAKAIETATGAARERLILELAWIEAQLAAREALGGNDRLADLYIDKLERSSLYTSLKDNPAVKTMLWAGLADTLNTGKYKQFVGNSVQAYLSLVVRAAQTLRFAGFDSSGNPVLVETSGSSGNSSVDPSLAAGAGGAARGQTGRVPGAVGVGIIVLGIGVAGQAVELAGPVLRDLFGRGRAVISSFSEWEKANQARRDAEVGTRAAAGSPDPNDPCNGYKPNLKIVANSARANKIAEGAGIQGTKSNGAAEEFKKLYVGTSAARFNLAFDKNTGRIWLEPVRHGEGNLIPTDYFTDGTFEPFDPEKGKC